MMAIIMRGSMHAAPCSAYAGTSDDLANPEHRATSPLAHASRGARSAVAPASPHGPLTR